MPFIQGESYTRDRIHEVLGGEKVSYLPQKDGKIVCGCFSTDANPEAPYVILVGGDDKGEEHPVERKARILEAGNTKRIRVGDRLFLLRQVVEPRGIIAAGWATSATYEGPHWDAERRSRGDMTLFVDLRFERILNPEYDEILPLEKLQAGSPSSVNWSTPASGIQIKQGVDDLERLWAELVGVYQPIGEDEPGALEGELRHALCRHRARERWLRDEKIAEVKRANSGRLPCQSCGFDFFSVYGEIGRDYAQVHHVKPLSDRTKPSMTRLSDLAILCANCHVMVHRGGEVRALDGMMAGRAD
jgi:hypothetical protein